MDSNDMNLDDDEFRDMVKRWVRGEIIEGRLPPSWEPDDSEPPHDGEEQGDE